MREDRSLCRLGEESAAEPAVRGVPNRSKDYPATSTSVEIIRLDSRRSLLHSGHFEAAQSDVLQRQERQIVQSRLNLGRFLAVVYVIRTPLGQHLRVGSRGRRGRRPLARFRSDCCDK